MLRKAAIIGCCLLVFGCAAIHPKPMIYPGNNSARYQHDLAECEEWAKDAAREGTASVADGAVTGGIGGALLGVMLGAALGAALGDPGLGAMLGTAGGGVQGAAGGAAYSAVERESRRRKAVVMCLGHRGYEAVC